ncbi:hypothetical protein GOV04_00970 [Candidatus Woesearchaeota archaeon]|nr:hypothetical protein [Candidatus Woesearchaeota archaeon]
MSELERIIDDMPERLYFRYLFGCLRADWQQGPRKQLLVSYINNEPLVKELMLGLTPNAMNNLKEQANSQDPDKYFTKENIDHYFLHRHVMDLEKRRDKGVIQPAQVNWCQVHEGTVKEIIQTETLGVKLSAYKILESEETVFGFVPAKTGDKIHYHNQSAVRVLK